LNCCLGASGDRERRERERGKRTQLRD
jgi:hypothetical protein